MKLWAKEFTDIQQRFFQNKLIFTYIGPWKCNSFRIEGWEKITFRTHIFKTIRMELKFSGFSYIYTSMLRSSSTNFIKNYKIFYKIHKNIRGPSWNFPKFLFLWPWITLWWWLWTNTSTECEYLIFLLALSMHTFHIFTNSISNCFIGFARNSVLLLSCNL